MKVQLAAAVSHMSEREQLILSLYYYEELTMKEVSEVVGIAVSRVSQIHAAAMLKLRVSLAHLRETAASPLEGVQPVGQNTGSVTPWSAVMTTSSASDETMTASKSNVRPEAAHHSFLQLSLCRAAVE